MSERVRYPPYQQRSKRALWVRRVGILVDSPTRFPDHHIYVGSRAPRIRSQTDCSNTKKVRMMKMFSRPLCRRSIIGAITFLLLGTAGVLEARSSGHGRIEQVSIHSTALAGNLVGDPVDQTFSVYLPASYDSSKRRYPVVLL